MTGPRPSAGCSHGWDGGAGFRVRRAGKGAGFGIHCLFSEPSPAACGLCDRERVSTSVSLSSLTCARWQS